MIVGIKTTTEGATLRQLRKSIPGFLELFSKRKFDRLVARGYQSLLKFDAYPDTILGSKQTYYAVLFGPMALVNSNNNVREQFYHVDEFGDLLIWRARMHFEEVTMSILFLITDILKYSYCVCIYM
jgi:hypothetical protein